MEAPMNRHQGSACGTTLGFLHSRSTNQQERKYLLTGNDGEPDEVGLQKPLKDDGSNFVSEAKQTVCKRIGIKKTQTSFGAPQTYGLVERPSRTLQSALAYNSDNDLTLG
ncbi:unnamed protein product [Umbelopsis ramanniana]